MFVEHLRAFNFEFSAICTQESFISDKDDLSQIELEGYTLIPQGKSCSNNGGLVMYLHERVKHEYKLKLNKQNSWKGQFIQIRKGENFTHPIIIGNIYRPPNDLISSYKEFTDKLCPILKTLGKKKSEVIIAGDFNIDILIINDKHTFSEYFDMLINNCFILKLHFLQDFQTIMEH